ncbi:MAG: Spx/MgsR family RNA polymerase-binding regulatory protein [Gammaproteobacteria bacterium]|jgi:arsenate reductase|nr:Spx/MgsR family RNA polymerase-binding regulatory protein [Gammaproteobacteria bacterium]MDP6973564.1 Spx/MgsR family RNA polymerase-binding regulatory protein [Gammaproteobacteria bacterium]
MNKDIQLYGISNCDTVRKAIKYLDINDIRYQFIDYRKNPISLEKLQTIVSIVGWENLINRRSTTYRSLSEKQKKNINYDLVLNYPTLIKRPVLISEDEVLVGFSENKYATIIG